MTAISRCQENEPPMSDWQEDKSTARPQLFSSTIHFFFLLYWAKAPLVFSHSHHIRKSHCSAQVISKVWKFDPAWRHLEKSSGRINGLSRPVWPCIRWTAIKRIWKSGTPTTAHVYLTRYFFVLDVVKRVLPPKIGQERHDRPLSRLYSVSIVCDLCLRKGRGKRKGAKRRSSCAGEKYWVFKDHLRFPSIGYFEPW
jgi:hypothetical protein